MINRRRIKSMTVFKVWVTLAGQIRIIRRSVILWLYNVVSVLWVNTYGHVLTVNLNIVLEANSFYGRLMKGKLYLICDIFPDWQLTLTIGFYRFPIRTSSKWISKLTSNDLKTESSCVFKATLNRVVPGAMVWLQLIWQCIMKPYPFKSFRFSIPAIWFSTRKVCDGENKCVEWESH